MNAKYTVSAVSTAQNQSQSHFRYIAPELILPNPKQPRRSIETEALSTLKESIRERGILQPLLVMRGEMGQYILVAGQRRLAAARALGLVRVPIMMLNEERPDYLVDSLLENIQREELSGIDEGHSFIALKEEFKWSQREIATRIHKHESYVSERIRTAERLTAVTKEIISQAFELNENLARAKFSHSISRKLALLPPEDQEELARLVATTDTITARQVEQLVRAKLGTTKIGGNLDLVENQLYEETGDQLRIKTNRGHRYQKPKINVQQLTMAGVLPGEGFEAIPTKPQKKSAKTSVKNKKNLLLENDLNDDQTFVHTMHLLDEKIASANRVSLSELIAVLRKDLA